MSHLKPLLVLALPTMLLVGSARSQQLAQEPSRVSALTGSVTGFVYDSATRLPLRFAEVNVVPIPSATDLAPVKDQPLPRGIPRQQPPRVRLVSGTSGMDGSFHLEGIPAGDYLVTALKPGYVSQGMTALMAFSFSAAQLESILTSILHVRIGAGESGNVTLTLRRGAVITGRMEYADGSPVIGAKIGCESVEDALHLEAVMRPENRGKVASPRQEALEALTSSRSGGAQGLTDDEGRYRISGLLPGKYLVSTMLLLDHSLGRIEMTNGTNPPTNKREHMFPEMAVVYASDAFERKEARVFDVHEAEQISDADLTIDPSKLHNLKGKVLTAGDRHAPDTMIWLKHVGTKDVPRVVEIDEDGTFEVHYLPFGAYTLDIVSSDSAERTGSERTEYKTVKITAVVGDRDVTLDEVLVVPLKPGEKNPDFVF